jgi:hypothetical protein
MSSGIKNITGAIQPQETVTPPEIPKVGSVTKVPPEVDELMTLLTELFQETSELVLTAMEIDDEMVRNNPTLKELKSSCVRVARIVRRIIQVGRKMPKTPLAPVSEQSPAASVR